LRSSRRGTTPDPTIGLRLPSRLAPADGRARPNHRSPARALLDENHLTLCRALHFSVDVLAKEPLEEPVMVGANHDHRRAVLPRGVDDHLGRIAHAPRALGRDARPLQALPRPVDNLLSAPGSGGSKSGAEIGGPNRYTPASAMTTISLPSSTVTIFDRPLEHTIRALLAVVADDDGAIRRASQILWSGPRSERPRAKINRLGE